MALFLIWGKKGEEQQEETAEKELVIPKRWPRPEHATVVLPRTAPEKASTASAASTASPHPPRRSSPSATFTPLAPRVPA